MSNSVGTATAASLRNSSSLQKVRDLRGGVDAMREAGEIYLPQEERESADDYEDRKARSWLLPALDKAIEDVADRVFAKPVQFGEDVPELIHEWAGNIDNDGRNLNNFARDVFEDGVEAGVSYILVDSPIRTGEATRATAQELNLRPYLVHVRAEDVLGWKTASIGNRTILTQVRIMETVTVDDPDDEFAQEEVDQVRVLTLPVEDGRVVGNVNVRLYRKPENGGDWALYMEPFDTGVDEITIVPFYSNRVGFFQGAPRYEPLADLNIAHWQSASDQRNILHTARVPLLMFFGMQMDEVKQASNSAISTAKSKAEADAKFIEHSGAAIQAGRDDLTDLEGRMQVLGIELMLKPTSNKGATGAALDHEKVTTPLAMMANNLQDTLEKALEYMALYSAADGGGSVMVNTDFGLGMLTSADLTFLLQAVNTSQISHETFLKECVRRNVLMSDLDIDDEKERIEDEAPEPVVMPGLDESDDDENDPADAIEQDE